MKNVKCRDVWQFYPLLSKLKAEDENAFQSYVKEHFVDDVHDSIYAMFEGGVINDPAQTVITEGGQTITPETEQKPTGVEVEIQGRTSRPSNTELSEVVDVSAIALSDVWLRKATSEFKRRLVSASIIDIETGTIIDANGASGVGGSTGTVLNDNISAYKLELLNKVAKFLGMSEVQTVEDALATSEENPTLSTWEYILQQFGAHPGDNSIGYKNALGATVILRRFDAWLETNAPYVQIRTPYKNSSMFEPNRYVYQGPTMKMFQNFSSDEYMDATKYGLSDVVKIILEAFPEYDNNGNPLPGTQIGVNGLYAIGSKIKDVMQAKHKDLWYSGVDRFSEVGAEGNPKIFGIYDKLMKTVGTKENPHITSLTTKYNGLKKLMSTLPIELKRLFSHTIDKVVSSEYRAIELSESKHTEYDKGGYKRTIVERGGRVKNYRERPTTTMKTYLSSCVNGASLMLRKNANREALLKNHGIVVKGQKIYYEAYSKTDPIAILSNDTVTVKAGAITESDFLKIVSDILHYPISSEYSETAQFYKVRTDEKSRIVYDWAPLVAMALINGCHNGQFIPIPDGQLQQVAKVLSVMNGSEAATVIKNHEGNNLPMHQVTCLAYRHLDIHRYHEQAENNNRIKNNIIYQNIDKVLTPQCRTDTIDSEGHSVSFSKMNATDALGFSLVFDFWKPLHDHTDKDNYQKIALQATTYADKGKQPQQVFDISRKWIFKDAKGNDQEINLHEELTKICAGDTNAFNNLKEVWRRVEKTQMDITVNQIIADYNKVFGKKLKTLSRINSFIASEIKNGNITSVEDIRKKFLSAGVSFIENFHAVKFDGKIQVNECITEFSQILKDDQAWENFASKHLGEFENTVKSMPKEFWQYMGTKESPLKEGDEINLAKAYFIANNLLEGQYNRMMIGDYYLHDNKSKTGTIDAASASRYVSQIKRMVIYGATTHTYAQGLKDGVPKKVKVACIEDLQSAVQNIVGDTSSIDSCDGSGLTNPYYSRMENRSLLDAGVGDVKKTIMHDIGTNGVPKLLKWAEYAITNRKRRDSWRSDVRYETIFKNMNSEKVPLLDSEYSKVFENVFYFNPESNKHYKATVTIFYDESIKSNVAYIQEIEVDSKGKSIDNLNVKDVVPRIKTIKTIYDLDQALGGAWSKSLNSNGYLEYSEDSLDKAFEVIVDNDWRGNMIGIVTNKSALKVGIENLNSSSAWTEDTNLHTFEMSTEFGGLQMDADHELDDADVTEMTQMISALVQNGFSMEIAEKIYSDIGKYCAQSVEEISKAIGSKEELHKIFGKAMVEAFATGEKDTLGLAQAFIAIASKNMQEAGIGYIPFSSSSINGIFNATVTTSIVKKAIRRHYSGVAAVLNPAFGSIQVFNVGGKIYKYTELSKWLDKNNGFKTKSKDGIPWSLSELFDLSERSNGAINPTFQLIDETTYLDFEDTITFKQPESGKWLSLKIKDYKSYWAARRVVKEVSAMGIQVYIKQLAPKNLKGADTRFKLIGGIDRVSKAPIILEHSMFETIYAKLLYATHDVKATTIEEVIATVAATFKGVYKEEFSGAAEAILRNAIGADFNYKRMRRRLAKKQQEFLTNLHSAKQELELQKAEGNTQEFAFTMDGKTYKVTDVEVIPAQIIMGRYYAKQFGLTSQDNIEDILGNKEFFFEKTRQNYTNEIDNNPFDLTLYDGNGDQIHVMYDPTGTKIGQFGNSLSRFNDFIIVNGEVFYNEKPFCKESGKEFYTYHVGDKAYKVVVVKNLNDLSDLTKNNWTDYSECHYTSGNAKWLLENVNGLTITDGVVTLKGKKDGVEYTYDVNTTTPDGIAQLNEYSHKSKNSYIGRISYFKHDSFKKSLNFIGTRIPCQSMQSFAPMRVVAFSDSELNEVFVPTNIMWLEGSDLDIDKQYILGYTVSDTGRIFSGDLEHHKEDCLKNNVVENIWKTVTDPRNQINLTQPISTDDMKALAATSHKGSLAEKMSYYNPFHKYSMQVENMVGKDCIGNVATAIKGFFALTYMYNTRMNEMCGAIESGKIDEAMRLFNRYFAQPLANVNVERLDYVTELLVVPEDDQSPEANTKRTFRKKLLALKDIIEDQEDMSMLMGQLLNAATDNAKELILKKINADVNWIDMYTSAFMVGETLDTVGATMLNPITEAVLDIFDSSFLQESNFSKIGYLKGLQTGLKAKIVSRNPKVNALLSMGLKDSKGEAYEKEQIADHVDEMLRRAEAAEETRILGRFLKINQGLYTNRAEMHAYLLDIKTYFEHIYCESDPMFDAIKRISKTLSNSKLNLQLLVDGVENIKHQETREWYTDIWNNLADDLVTLEKIDMTSDDINGSIKQFIRDILMDDDNRAAFSDEISTTMSKIVENCRFDVIKFASDETYRTEQIEKYEGVKKQFNILEAVATSPHFNQMFSMVSINESILTEMSVRNALEDMVIEEYNWKRRMDGNTFKLGKTAIKSLQRRVDEVLRNEWIFGLKDLAIPVSKGQVYWNGSKYVKAEKDMSVGILVQTPSDINTLRYYIEHILIPQVIANPRLSDNKFLQNLSFGEKAGVPFWKPTLNMSTIGQSVKTQTQYEELLNDFEKLYDVKIAGIRFVDWLYLYNMIVHQDKMGSNTFTRFFEGLVGRGVESYAYDYSKWIDTADVSAIYSRNESQLLRFADEEPEVDDSYVKHFKYNSKVEIEMDSNDEWDTLAKEAKLSEKELEICKQRADQLYVLNVSPTEVGVPTKLDLGDGFCNGGSQIVLMRKGFDNQFAKLKVGDVIAINDTMFRVEKPLMKAFSDKELEQAGVQKVEPIAPKSVVNMSEPSSFRAYSGAADGADTEWKEVAKLWGIDTTDYTPQDYDELSSEWKQTIETAYQSAVKNLGRIAYSSDTTNGKLVRRDYLQARKADAVFAVGKIVAPGEKGLPNSSGKIYTNKTSHDVVDGGTGYAIQMAIEMGKPVHVFDPYQEEWFIWNGSSFVRERTPVLTPKFAAIGSRRLTSDPKWIMGKVAIRNVFAETAKKYGWDTDRGTDLISFNSFEEMVAKHNKVSNKIITTREANAKYHYGNPFTHRTGTSATIILPTVKDAAAAYRAWLLGETTFTTSKGETIDISAVEPERRKWIQDQISSGALDGKTLIYYTTTIGTPNGYEAADGSTPKYFSDEFPSHAHVLKELVNSRHKKSTSQKSTETTSIGYLDTTIYRGYATMSETDANDLDETVAGTAMDYIDPVFDAGYHFTTSKSEALDYAKGRTDKSDETFMDDSGNVVTQRNRHYTGDYAHVTAYKIDPSAKVLHFKNLDEANNNPELLKTADVVILHQGTLASSGAMEYIVRKGAKRLIHKITNFTTEDVGEIKTGSVVEYNNALYLVRGFSSNGGLQLISTDGSNFSGTPQPNKVTAVKHQYPVISHNGTDYIVTNNDNIYTLAKTAKGSRLVYTADASNVGKDRNFLVSRAMVQRGQARYHSSQNYIVTESGSVYKTNGELYTAEHAQQIARETYPEKFTTQPIVPTTIQSDNTTSGIVLNSGQRDAVDGVLKFFRDPSDYEPVVVNGKAGTGKTTIVNEILKEYERPQSVWIVALSHKAKQVLMDKLSADNKIRYNIKGKTIASSQGKTLDFDTGKFADGDKETQFPSIIFVDEASMVEDEAFAKFLKIAEEHHTKIVFLGDSGQLPPIKDEDSSPKVAEVSPVFKLPKQFKLTERVRQGEESPILPYTDYYWEYSHAISDVLPTRAENVSTITSKGALIFDEVMSIPYSFFDKAIKTGNPNLIKIVTYTNDVRREINQKVHERFFGDIVWGEGELIMFFDNYGDNPKKMIANSSEAVILKVGPEKPVVSEFLGYSVQTNKIELTIKVNDEVRQISVFASPKDKMKFDDFLKKVASKISAMAPGRERTEKWRTYYDFKKSYANIDYSYAITAHKSQGSTYDTVIVNVPDINKMRGVDAARGIYTAITRAKNVAVISGVRTDSPYEGDLLALNDSIESSKKPKIEPTLSVNSFQKSSSETKAQLKELIAAIDSPYLREVTDADFEGVNDFTADADGFVQDGVIYINTDRASIGTLIHELGHLYLGALKSDPNKRTTYYKILSEMHIDCDLWQEMQGNQFYANKRGSDFDEEIAARLIENCVSGGKMSYRDWLIAKRLVSLTDVDFKSLPKPEKMQWLSENYKIKQRVATLKNQLYEDEVIKDIDC